MSLSGIVWFLMVVLVPKSSLIQYQLCGSPEGGTMAKTPGEEAETIITGERLGAIAQGLWTSGTCFQSLWNVRWSSQKIIS